MSLDPWDVIEAAANEGRNFDCDLTDDEASAVERFAFHLLQLQADALPAADAPHMPGMNRTETTQAMREAALPRSGTLRHRMVMSLLNFPTTDDDLEVTLGRPHTSVSAARNGLVQQGWLQPYRIDGEVVKRPTRAGNPAIVWTVTPAARLRLALDR